jgi:hypothetical protein
MKHFDLKIKWRVGVVSDFAALHIAHDCVGVPLKSR